MCARSVRRPAIPELVPGARPNAPILRPKVLIASPTCRFLYFSYYTRYINPTGLLFRAGLVSLADRARLCWTSSELEDKQLLINAQLQASSTGRSEPVSLVYGNPAPNRRGRRTFYLTSSQTSVPLLAR